MFRLLPWEYGVRNLFRRPLRTALTFAVLATVIALVLAVALADRAGHFPRQLSGGQEQRVGIARAIVANPELVVADEPTGDLDPETSEQILGLLRRINQELSTTILMVTHDQEAAAIAGRQLRMDAGKIHEAVGADGR